MMELVKFEQELKPMQLVEARWTNNHRYYRAAAYVLKVNKASVRVRLMERVMYGAQVAYPEGHELVMPLGFNFSSGAFKWSENNGVFPLPDNLPKVVVEVPFAGTPVTQEEHREAERQVAEDAEEQYPEDR